MPARARWSWLEAYGLLATDPGQIHGSDWKVARDSASAALEDLIPRSGLDVELAEAADWIDAEPDSVLHQGSGWGALERRLRSSLGDDSLVLPGLPFPDDTLGALQAPWLSLLETGRWDASEPASYQVHAGWRSLLEKTDDWLGLLHLGVARFQAGDRPGAREAWTSSLDRRPTAWAHRNLAVLDLESGSDASGIEHYRRALELSQESALLLEAVRALIRVERPAEALEIIEGLPEQLRTSGRFQLAEAWAGLATGDLVRVGRLLDCGVEVADLREGEASLDRLWSAYHERSAGSEVSVPPVPQAYDFRMR